MRRATLLALLAAALAVPAAALGAGGDTVQQRWESAKTHVTLVMGTSDYAPGDVRVSFLVISADSKLLSAPRATLSLARGLKEQAFVTGTAGEVSILPPGGKAEPGEPGRLFVGHIRVPGPGTYFLLAELQGVSISGIGNVVVPAQTAAIPVGAAAPASQTPTLATVKDVTKLTTRIPPDRELLKVSVADALKRHQPFVLVFATPKFCSSRTCGPVVDVVDAVRKRWAGTPVQFIHVEIYAGNVPSNGPNRWALQWRLPTEPWIFLVGADGRVKARFEGALSVAELQQAIVAKLGVKAA